MKNRPPYAIGSVDHALHLAQLLQQEGPLRVTDAAEQLGVSRSTAHRLLAMLVYRDFAEQIDDRRYRAGPVLRPTEASEAPVALLRRVAQPHLRALVDRVRESANLVVLAGTEIRFLTTVTCDQVLRVGDRAGRALPAHLTSGGKALLAALTDEELDHLYDSPDGEVDLAQLRRELGLVRKRGFAVNDGLTEIDMSEEGDDEEQEPVEEEPAPAHPAKKAAAKKAAAKPKPAPEPEDEEVELIDGPMRLGAKARIRQPRLPTVVWEVTKWEPGRSWTWAATSPGARTEASHVLTRSGEGTLAEQSISSSGPLGRVVADRYRLISLLGEGGMGAVYKAEHIRMGKALALKATPWVPCR